MIKNWTSLFMIGMAVTMLIAIATDTLGIVAYSVAVLFLLLAVIAFSKKKSSRDR